MRTSCINIQSTHCIHFHHDLSPRLWLLYVKKSSLAHSREVTKLCVKCQTKNQASSYKSQPLMQTLLWRCSPIRLNISGFSKLNLKQALNHPPIELMADSGFHCPQSMRSSSMMASVHYLWSNTSQVIGFPLTVLHACPYHSQQPVASRWQ